MSVRYVPAAARPYPSGGGAGARRLQAGVRTSGLNPVPVGAIAGGRTLEGEGGRAMGLVCLVCGSEIDISLLASLSDDAMLCCPVCDDEPATDAWECPVEMARAAS
jgi:hypothetical protein